MPTTPEREKAMAEVTKLDYVATRMMQSLLPSYRSPERAAKAAKEAALALLNELYGAKA